MRLANQVVIVTGGGLGIGRAYCERLGTPLAEYRRRFAAAPAQMLDTPRDAPAEYHDKLTVAKTFALAINEAAKLHPAAEPLIVVSPAGVNCTEVGDTPGSEKLFADTNHLNPRGTAVLAELMERDLLATGLLPCGASPSPR